MSGPREPTYCGDCGRYVGYEEPSQSDWEGFCNSLGIGRNRDTRACKNPSTWNKRDVIERVQQG